jgi:hypothetical protein
VDKTHARFSLLVLACAPHLAHGSKEENNCGGVLADHWHAPAFRRRACLTAACDKSLAVSLLDSNGVRVILYLVRDKPKAALVTLDALRLAP